tara:strand:+ start:120 stop:389 length:270 start_codon:yes stop_codon:yes gene_type:complete
MKKQDLVKMSLTELRELHIMVYDVLKLKRSSQSLEIAQQLNVGQIVEVINSTRLSGRKCTVTKINRKKVKLQVEGMGVWNVPMTMIKIK